MYLESASCMGHFKRCKTQATVQHEHLVHVYIEKQWTAEWTLTPLFPGGTPTVRILDVPLI